MTQALSLCDLSVSSHLTLRPPLFPATTLHARSRRRRRRLGQQNNKKKTSLLKEISAADPAEASERRLTELARPLIDCLAVSGRAIFFLPVCVLDSALIARRPVSRWVSRCLDDFGLSLYLTLALPVGPTV